MDNYKDKIKTLYYEIYKICLVHGITEKQLLQIFSEAEKEVLLKQNKIVKNSNITVVTPDETTKP